MSSVSSSSSGAFTLYYWPRMLGRAEMIRLLAAELGMTYDEPLAALEWEQIRPLVDALKARSPFFALPVIDHEGQLISQTHCILAYLAQHIDGGRLFPATPALQARALSLEFSLNDVIGEGHDAWHAIDKNASYVSQAKQCEPYIQAYTDKRLPKWLAFFHSVLEHNHATEQHGFTVGDKLSYGTPQPTLHI